MTVDTLFEQSLIAFLGGVAAEFLHWYALARKPEGISIYAKGATYWITTAGMVILGGAMPLLYIEGSASALLCFHLGAATPVILQKLVANVPSPVAAQGLSGTSIRNFFTW